MIFITPDDMFLKLSKYSNYIDRTTLNMTTLIKKNDSVDIENMDSRLLIDSNIDLYSFTILNIRFQTPYYKVYFVIKKETNNVSNIITPINRQFSAEQRHVNGNNISYRDASDYLEIKNISKIIYKDMSILRDYLHKKTLKEIDKKLQNIKRVLRN